MSNEICGYKIINTEFEIEYNPSLTLPPDALSDNIGQGAGQAVNAIAFRARVAKNATRPINVLELGVGCGIGLVSLVSRLKGTSNLVLDGIDIDEYCVRLTNYNLGRASRHFNHSFESNIYTADWLKESTWEKLRQKQYDVIMFNPPYLPLGEQVRPGYENVPSAAMYTNDNDGLEHYQQVIPRIASIFCQDEGSTFFIRMPRSTGENSERFRKIDQIIMNLAKQIPDCSFNEIIEATFGKGRRGSMATLFIGQSCFDPLIQIAQRDELSFIPTTVEELLNAGKYIYPS